MLKSVVLQVLNGDGVDLKLSGVPTSGKCCFASVYGDGVDVTVSEPTSCCRVC